MNETQYWAYYEAVRDNVMKAIFCFYTNLEIHKFASESRDNYNAVNQSATFWNTSLYGQQIAFFMALSRIFDNGPDVHTMEKFLAHTVAHPEFFTVAAFEARRLRDVGGPRPNYLDDYLRSIWVPDVADLKVIARMLRPLKPKARGVQTIRNQVFAHTIAIDRTDVADLFGQTLIGDIDDILYGLYDILEIILQLYMNGRRPEERNRTYRYKDDVVTATRQFLERL